MLTLPGTNGGPDGCILSRFQLLSAAGLETDSLARRRRPQFAAVRFQPERGPQLGFGHTQSGPRTTSSNVQSRLLGPDDRVSHARGAAVHGEDWLHAGLPGRRAETWLAAILHVGGWISALRCT